MRIEQDVEPAPQHDAGGRRLQAGVGGADGERRRRAARAGDRAERRSRLAVVPATAHVVGGALLLATCLVLTIRAARAPSSREASRGEVSPGGRSEPVAPAAAARAAGSAA